MSREIKFRAWENGKMLQVHTLDLIKRGAKAHFSHGEDGGCTHITEIAVLMQFTGLKDKNGVEIWEGDIVEFGMSSERYEIKFDTSRAAFVAVWNKFNEVDNYLKLFAEHCKILGNIHQNPELLEA